ncbi:sulfite exporter TauE/SafE [Clostridium puniceum]|uniref:Probable membrane transporter protein n=1 Tax=Clostridium puniceum TaxID=29367 RepID=A0A1S8TQF6_9CLOT|nr:sulfite exporter TauE/SafE family protein [Clostridium puniceum]OOM79635.1 sulfite exporter TauE/SafE [Clostridium puniceum]
MFGFISILLAAFTQGITGFGFALIAVPLLSLFIPEIRNITPIIVIYSLLTNIIIGYKSRSFIDLKRIIPLIIFGIIATPIGTYLLLMFKVSTLKIIIGLVTSITALSMFKNFKINIKNQNIYYGIVGLLSGLLNGSTGLSGPPVVLFLTNQNTDKDVFRANLSFYGIATNIFAIIIFIVEGIINTSILNFTALYLPALMLGVFTGIKTSTKINESIFRKITIGLIALLGFYTFMSTILAEVLF